MSKYEYFRHVEDKEIYRVKAGEPGRGNYETFSPYDGDNGKWVRCSKDSSFDPRSGFDQTSGISEETAKAYMAVQMAYRKEHNIPEGKYFPLSTIKYYGKIG